MGTEKKCHCLILFSVSTIFKNLKYRIFCYTVKLLFNKIEGSLKRLVKCK